MISLLMPQAATLPEHVDERAFAAATAELRPHVRAVVAAVMNLPRDHADVEDCTHEALKRAIEGRSRLRPGEPLRPWLSGIARHVALDAMRSRKRQRDRTAAPHAGDGDGSSPDPLERVADPAPDAFDHFSTAQRRQAVARALAALPDGQRQALVMFHMEGLQYQEIAVRLGVPLGTVATWVMRARKSVAASVGVTEES